MNDHSSADKRDELILLLNQILPSATPGQILRLVQLLGELYG